MPDVFSFDARDGIDTAALDQLRRASHFALGFVNSHTAVLGYWVSESDAKGQTREHFGTVGLRCTATTADLPPARLFPGPWRHIWRNVSPGDNLRAVVLAGAATVAISPPRKWDRSQPFMILRPARRQSSPSGPDGPQAAR